MNMPTLTLAQHAGPLTRLIFGERGSSALARDTDHVFMWILAFDVFWFVLLMGLMFFWVVKYRRRPGVPAQRSPHHNTRLELVWTIVPSLFLGAMFYFGFDGYITKIVAPTNAETISVVGQKWQWVITYANGVNPLGREDKGGKTDVPVILVPVGRPVQFRMTSVDVLHSFWIPDFRFKFDVMPNRYTNFWITAEEPGDHWVFCAEYCGDYHSEMASILRAVPADEYDATLKQWFMEAGAATPAERGQKLVMVNGCATCHTINGQPSVGPTWLNAWGYEAPLADGTSIPADDSQAWDNYIRESIINPSAKIHAGFPSPSPMTSYAGAFNEEQLGWIVAYIKSLSDKATPPPAEGEAPVPPAEGDAPATPEQ